MSGSVTPFLKLQKPPFDTIPWDQAVNGNMDIIDAFVQRYMAVPNYMGGWLNSTNYISGQNVLDVTNATIYLCQVTHVSAASPTTFLQDRTARPTYWAATTNVSSGSSSMTVSDVPPGTSKQGDLWWDSVGAELYVFYNDGGSLQWVVANNQSGMMGEAPNDGNVYGRQRSAWTPVAPGAVGSVGRNLIHNSMMNIAQRGAGPFTASGFALDRWRLAISSDTASLAQTAFSDASRTAVGDEAATFALVNTITGNAAAGAFTQIVQGIENVRRLAGKTVIVSFWAAGSAALKLGINGLQYFGTGGSPSAAAYTQATGAAITMTTNWVRYSVTLTIPSIVGLTVGTNGDNYTGLIFWLSSGATNNVAAGNIGVQSGTFQLWGVQLEIAAPGQTQPTPLEKPDPELQLRQCQRFYQVGWIGMTAAGQTGVSNATIQRLPVQPRATPTYAIIGTPTYSNASAAIIGSFGEPGTVQAAANVTASGSASAFYFNYSASADL